MKTFRHISMNTSADIGASVKAWREASVALGIEVVAPYILRVGPRRVKCIAYVAHFGGPNGIVIGPSWPPDFQTDEDLVQCAKSRDLCYSFLNLEVYRNYDAETFREALRDWGYCGPSHKRPNWL